MEQAGGNVGFLSWIKQYATNEPLRFLTVRKQNTK